MCAVALTMKAKGILSELVKAMGEMVAGPPKSAVGCGKQALNHLKRLLLKVVVVSVEEKANLIRQVWYRAPQAATAD